MKPDEYPIREVYEVLYAKYLQSPADTLLKIGGLEKGECVLDLCAGNLAQCHTALDMGAAIACGVDSANQMWHNNHGRKNLRCIWSDVETYLNRIIDGFATPFGAATFDLIVCRQAVNNWLTAETAARLPRHIYSNGRFVFNTFNTPPGEKPIAREYWLPVRSSKDNIVSRKYLEVSYRIGNMIHHVQIAEGYEPHYTTFRWIEDSEYRSMLEPYFDVQSITKDRTVYYICKVK